MNHKLFPTKRHHYKQECHKLLDKMFGWNHAGQTQAYKWLWKEYGEEIHFGQIQSEKKLATIYFWLLNRYMSNDYPKRQRGGKKVVQKLSVSPTPRKYPIAPNVAELQKLSTELNKGGPVPWWREIISRLSLLVCNF